MTLSTRYPKVIRLETLVCYVYVISQVIVNASNELNRDISLKQPMPAYGRLPMRPQVHLGSFVADKKRNEPENGLEVHRANPECHLTVNEVDALSFAKKVMRRSVNFAYLNLWFSDNASVTWEKEIFLPKVWVWTFTTPGGAYPYLRFPSDIYILSLGILTFYTLSDVKLHITASPRNCSLVIGEKSTTQKLADLLADMVLTHLDNPISANYSAFCYIVKLDPFVDGKLAFYVSTYLGFWGDLTGYKCCWLYRNQSGILKTICEFNKTKTLSQWTNFLYFIGIVCFLYIPIPICAVCSSLSLTPAARTLRSRYEYEDLDEIEESEDEEITFSDSSNANTNVDKWLYLGMDIPVTVFTILCRPFSVLKNYPVLTSRIQRVLVFLVIIPGVIFTKMLCYIILSPRAKVATKNRLNANIPVGFLSIPFGFWPSYQNWLTIFGGPYVVFGVYFVLGLAFFCTPHRFSDLLTSALRYQGFYRNTILSRNMKRIQEFGAVTLRNKTGYALLLNMMKGNLYSLLNPQYWKFVFNFFQCRTERLRNRLANLPTLAQWACLVAYYFMCLLECLLCILYYGFPSIFLMYLTIRAYLLCVTSNKCKIPISIFLVVSLVIIYYAFFLIFIRSAMFLLSIINYTYIGTLLYPNIALGFMIGVGTMVMYLRGSIQKLKDNYLTLFHNLVKISMELEKSTSERCAFIRQTTLVLEVNNIDLDNVETLQIGGVSFKLTNQQRNILRETRPFNRGGSCRNQKYVSWKGIHPGIPRSLFEYVTELYRPVRVSVFTFVVELSAFSVVVSSVFKLMLVFGRLGNFVLPAQIVTVIVLTVLPKLSEFFKSATERSIEEDMNWRRLAMTVRKYYGHNGGFRSGPRCRHTDHRPTELPQVCGSMTQ